MPRLMSVSHTEQQVRRRAKTVTRRTGWCFLKPGDRVTLVRKAMGLRKGERAERIVDVEIVDAHREPLDAITHDDVVAEGFPEWTVDQFLEFFTRSMGGRRDQQVTRIEWRYIEAAADTVEHAIAGWRFMYGDEKALQNGIRVALGRAGLEARPEVSLNPRGRIDFLVQRALQLDDGRGKPTGLEVKVKGTAVAATEQLQRYAPYVDELVLVTTRASHRAVPAVVGGKPCRVVLVRGAAW